MYVCVCVCTYICECVYMYSHTVDELCAHGKRQIKQNENVCVYMHICMCICIYMCVYICIATP